MISTSRTNSSCCVLERNSRFGILQATRDARTCAACTTPNAPAPRMSPRTISSGSMMNWFKKALGRRSTCVAIENNTTQHNKTTRRQDKTRRAIKRGKITKFTEYRPGNGRLTGDCPIMLGHYRQRIPGTESSSELSGSPLLPYGSFASSRLSFFPSFHYNPSIPSILASSHP
jgi:hypothetical protein